MEVVILRKFCAVVLFVFLASLVAAGTAFAVVRHEPDLRPVGNSLIEGNVIDGGRRLVVRAGVHSYDDVKTRRIYHWNLEPFNANLDGNLYLVARDSRTYANDPDVKKFCGVYVMSSDKYLVKPFPYQAADGWIGLEADGVKPKGFTITSNDHARLTVQSADLGLYYDFPDSVVDILSGGTGREDHNTYNPNVAYDFYGFAIGEPMARNIIGLHGRNPALAAGSLDTSAIAVYVNATQIDAASLSNAVSVPVPLNVTFDVAYGAHKYKDEDGKEVTVNDSRFIGGRRFNGDRDAASGLPDIKADRTLWEFDGILLRAPFTPALEIADGLPTVAFGDEDEAWEALDKSYEDRQQYWNNRFAGMRAGDIRFFKASVGDGPNEQIEYTRVDRATDLAQQRFVVTEYNQTTGTDTVLGTDDRLEGQGHLYRIVYRDRDGIPGVDMSVANSTGVIIGSPALIFAENPIIKQPDALGTLPTTSHWKYGYKPMTRTGLGLDGEYVARVAPFDGTQNRLANNLYPDYTRELFRVEADALWHTKAAVEGYGFDFANVIRFPGTLAEVSVGNTAVVLYTLRPGAGAGFGGSAGLDMLVANGNTVADLQVINATGNDAMPRNYTLVTSVGDLRDGTFAVFEQVVNGNVQRQRICPADEVFTAGKVYFLAVAAKDGGDFDVDQGTQGNNVGKNNRCVHFSVFAAVGGVTPVEPKLEIGASKYTLEPGEELQLTATRSDTGEPVAVAWTGSDDAVLTVDEEGLLTAVAVGTATVTATPTDLGSDLDPATKAFTVEVPQPGGGGSGGGCSVGFAPAAALLLAPLFVLLKK